MSKRPLDLERLAAFMDGLLSPEDEADVLSELDKSPELRELYASMLRGGSDPFQPNNISSAVTFSGRHKELDRLENLLRQTRAGNGASVLVTGEPGCGKSSLLMKLKALAEGKDFSSRKSAGAASIRGKQADAFRFLVVQTDIDPGTTEQGLLTKIVAGLERGLDAAEKTKGFLKDLLEFASRIEAFGVRLHEAPRSMDEAQMERFADHLARTVEAVTGARGMLNAQHEGVLLIIDEADKASPDLRLGSFLKLLAERLRWRGCGRFMMAVTGLQGLQDVLRTGHRSSLRLFEVIELQRMDTLACMMIVVDGLKRASEEGDPITIRPAALRQIVTMADGLPHFVQQLASSAFAVNKDDVIDEEDVEHGTYNAEGAVAALAVHYGWEELPSRKDGPWAVLKAVAEAPEAGVPVVSLTSSTGMTARKVRDAVERLAQERLIILKPGTDEPVRLATHSLRAWVRLEAARPPD